MAIAAKSTQLQVVRSLIELRQTISFWKSQGDRVALVPTMGSLHAGHLSLIETASATADRVIVSIFVNPSQFAPNEDFDTYPRSEEVDLQALAKTTCDLAYLPDVTTVYPQGFETSVSLSKTSQELCATSRPHFFTGVATVVNILFNQCQPDTAIFGEKDYQQLLVIKRMVNDLSLPIEIIGSPIIRDIDGLALSSRNAYLNDGQRKIAGQLNKILAEMAIDIEKGKPVQRAIADGQKSLEDAGVDRIDYLDIRDAEDLENIPTGQLSRPARIFLAAYVGDVRLIDNWPLNA